jgi:hypothetical protein
VHGPFPAALAMAFLGACGRLLGGFVAARHAGVSFATRGQVAAVRAGTADVLGAGLSVSVPVPLYMLVSVSVLVCAWVCACFSARVCACLCMVPVSVPVSVSAGGCGLRVGLTL